MKRSFPVSLDTTNKCDLTGIGRRPDDLVARAAWIGREAPTDSARSNRPLDVGENERIVCHLLEEVGNRKLVVLSLNLLPYAVHRGHTGSWFRLPRVPSTPPPAPSYSPAAR